MHSFKNYSIRLMNEVDLKIVLEWRNSDRIRLNMYSDDPIAWESHYEWYMRTRKSESSRHFIVELFERPIGVVNLTDIDLKNNKCKWGFYLGETDVPRGSGTALGVLGLSQAFEHLNLRKVCAEVFAFNEVSLRYHIKLGFNREGCLSRHVQKNGKYEDIVLFACFSNEWPRIKEMLSGMFG